MAQERSSITQAVQVGVEATPGAAVVAARRLGSIGFTFGPQIESNNQRPTGQKYNSLVTVGKEWSEADVAGSPVYTELPYIFASLINRPVVSQIMDGATATGAYRWSFDSSTFGEDAPKTFTLEQGSAARAHRVTNGIITDMEIDWDRAEVTLDGTLLARALEDGISMSSNPVGLPQVPVLPTHLSMFLDNKSADLGTTKLTRALAGTFSLGSRYAPLWVVDADQPSFVTTIEGEPELAFTITSMANAQGMSPLEAMRRGQTQFLRLAAQGPAIYTPATGQAIRHSMTIDVAGQVAEPNQLDDNDGVYAIEWGFGGVHDPEWGKALHVEVVTTLAAL